MNQKREQSDQGDERREKICKEKEVKRNEERAHLCSHRYSQVISLCVLAEQKKCNRML